MSIQKHTETKTYTENREVIDSVTCDLCGRAEKAKPDGNGIDWAPRTGHEHWRVEERVITIAHKHMVHTMGDYGDTSIETWSLDVCPDCFETKILALAHDKVRHRKVAD